MWYAIRVNGSVLFVTRNADLVAEDIITYTEQGDTVVVSFITDAEAEAMVQEDDEILEQQLYFFAPSAENLYAVVC
jgi:hypothetical protein